MIDERTLQPKPCPLCQSSNVRWRQRNLIDRGRTLLRFLAETVAGALMDTGSQIGRRYDQVRENVGADLLESRTGLSTPEYFWRCGGCGKRGYVIDGRVVTT